MKKIILMIVTCLALVLLTACGEARDSEIGVLTPQPLQMLPSERGAADGAAEDMDSDQVGITGSLEEGTESDEDMLKLRQMFGADCIPEQTFEVEISEYSGKVWFVPFAPSEENPEFSMQIIQKGEVLADIRAYVPEALTGEKFTSLEAVSFFDVNYDDCTDIVLIETYGSTSFAVVYYGFGRDAYDYERYFYSQGPLSDNISSQVEVLTIPKIRQFLTQGTKNGEFASYQEAYKAVSRLCQLENSVEQEYDLIYFDSDDIPELVTGRRGYYVSLYTYHQGKVYTLMDQWGYGAFGNPGYEYCPGKNSLRNYNADFAGAIVYTTYMTVSDRYTMDTVVQIEFYNFDDANGNGVPDEDEEDSLGYYGVSYINGVQVTEEECSAYDAGEYEYIEPAMSLEALWSRLNG